MKTILVVDDELGNAEVVSLILREEGFAASCAANGALGLAAARAVVPDLIVSDFMMPVMNGAEFVRALRADPTFANTRIILNSGLPEDSIARDLEGYDAFLRKPYPIARLIDMVHALIGPAKA